MDAGKSEQADTPDHERVGLADVCQQAIQYETPVSEGCGSQLRRLFVPEWWCPGDGLVFTNHHCGFSSIQQHSSVEHDYLKDGFVARNLSEELPNPELYVRFLLHQQDVTRRVLGAVKPDMNESERTSVVDSVMLVIGEEVSRKDSTLIGIVDAYYGGNEFWLSVYRDYNDVRLVFAPPSSVGKFGWDTDNWVWPRHTGDFAVFRIYAGKDNRPADYSPDNVPYHPEYVAPISLDGYREGSFCMTMGYPGSTERYLSSFGIEEMMTTTNQAQIDVRGVKQAIWKREMDSRDSIRIKYASKIRRKFQLLEEQHRSEPHHQETACAGQEACHGDRTPSLDTADTGGAGTSAASFFRPGAELQEPP